MTTGCSDYDAAVKRRGELESERERVRHDVVYFVQREDGAIKIGYSGDIENRLRAFEGARLLGFMPGDRRTESALHLVFRKFALGGEWFRPTEELLELAHCCKFGAAKHAVPLEEVS